MLLLLALTLGSRMAFLHTAANPNQASTSLHANATASSPTSVSFSTTSECELTPVLFPPLAPFPLLLSFAIFFCHFCDYLHPCARWSLKLTVTLCFDAGTSTLDVGRQRTCIHVRAAVITRSEALLTKSLELSSYSMLHGKHAWIYFSPL